MGRQIFIVTGAAGHLGSHVVRELLQRGKEVRALVLPNEHCPDFIDVNRHLLQEYVGDVCNPASFEPLFAGKDAEFMAIHCAGIVTVTKKEDRRVAAVNVGGTAKIIDACKRHHVNSCISALSTLSRGCRADRACGRFLLLVRRLCRAITIKPKPSLRSLSWTPPEAAWAR